MLLSTALMDIWHHRHIIPIAQEDTMHSAGLQDVLSGVAPDQQSRKQLLSLRIIRRDLSAEEEMEEVFPLLHCSACYALLTSERPYWSPRISRKKHRKTLGLCYLAHWQLSLEAEMKETGRTAPSHSSGGREAGRSKATDCTSLSLPLYVKWSRRLKLGQLHTLIGQNVAQWY